MHLQRASKLVLEARLHFNVLQKENVILPMALDNVELHNGCYVKFNEFPCSANNKRVYN